MQIGSVIAQRYKIERELGKGGCGAVYVAIDGKFNERIALKLAAASGNDYDAFRLRFAREARLGNKLGKIPGVVRAFDWGAVGTAGLYLAMDLVPDARPLDLASGTLEERLTRLRAAAALVAAAHTHRVVHRDIKPANFLQGPDGRIWLTDFGLAKVQGEFDKASDTGMTTLTQRGDVMGTPAFMPPEQFDDVSSVDERADIYALGVMLYLAVGSKPPFDARSSFELRLKMEGVKNGSQKHPRLSTSSPGTPPALDSLAARATAVDRNERLATAAEFVAELDAILARPGDSSQGAAVAAASGRGGLALIAVVLGAFLLAAGVTAALLFGVLGRSKETPPPVDDGSATVASSSVATPGSETTVATPTSTAETSPPVTTDTPAVETPPTVVDTSSQRIADLPEGALGRLGTLRLRHGREVAAVAFTPDVKTLVTADLKGRVETWALPEGTPGDELSVARENVAIRAIALSPRAGLVVAAEQSRVWVTSMMTRREYTSFEPGVPVHALAASDDETLVATNCAGGIRVWTLDASQPPLTLATDARLIKLAFSPDGTLLAAGCEDSRARIWSIPEGKLVATLGEHGARVAGLAFSGDGKVLATGSADRTVRLWSMPDGAPLGTFPPRVSGIGALALSPDGRWLVSSGEPHLQLWSTERREKFVRFLYALDFRVVAYSPDGAWVAAGCFGGGVPLWNPKTGERVAPRTAGHVGGVQAVAFARDGATLASASLDRSLEVWDTSWRQATTTLNVPLLTPVHGVATLPDGRIVSGEADGVVRIWSGVRSAVVVRAKRGNHRYNSVATSPDGKLIASVWHDTPIALLAVPANATGELTPLAELKAPRHRTWSVTFSPDGKTLAATGYDGSVRLWSVESHRQIRSIPASPKGPCRAAAFSPDGKTLAVGCDDGTLRLWDLDGARGQHELEGHSGAVWSVAFSPDGKLLASAGDDRIVRLQDLETQGHVVALRGHRAAVHSVAFSPDGKTLASGSEDSTIVLWDVLRVIETK